MATNNSGVVWGQVQEDWFGAVNHFARATPWLHSPARVYAEYGVAVFAGLLIVGWWLARRDGDLRRMSMALWAPFGALVALGVNQLLVAGVAEPRPYTVMPHALVLVSPSADYSFPSDHAVMAGAVAAGILLANRKLGAVAAVLAVLMALSRVYVGAHFPLDVAVGLVVGSALALGSYAAVATVTTRLVTSLSRTPVRPFLMAEHSGGVR